MNGDITVRSGGTLTLDNATFRFRAASDGILVESGGVLRVKRSVLEPAANEETSYTVDLLAGSTLLFNLTTLRGGQGLKLRTSDADVSGNSFEDIPLALYLDHVEVTIHHNEFLRNEVALNQTGGANTLHANRFDGGEYCVRNWLTDPTITENVFRGCHVGILHQNSHSVLRANDMEDQSEPPGVGILVQNTNSPLIEGNRIAKYGTGILVQNATAYIRSNEIVENVGDGVRVEANTQPMDITDNLIARNGGDGVDLRQATGVEIRGNDIRDNGGYGIVSLDAPGLVVSWNDISANAVDGIGLVDTAEAFLHNNTAQGNNATGIVVGVGSPGARLHDNVANGNGQHGIFLRSDGAEVRRATASGNGLSGVALVSLGGAVLSGITAEENGVHGMRLVDASAEGSDLTLRWNAADGLRVEGGGERRLVRLNASGNAGDGIRIASAGWTTLEEPRAIANGGNGLHQTDADAVSASLAWWEDNGDAGVRNAADASLDSRCAYWGSPLGPWNEENPAGDEVVGPVLWDPYRTSPDQGSCETEPVY